jgi:hypothetical protein
MEKVLQGVWEFMPGYLLMVIEKKAVAIREHPSN